MPVDKDIYVPLLFDCPYFSLGHSFPLLFGTGRRHCQMGVIILPTL